jgi:L,D-peptidoglycan transpeptidase YkuD (ErfK/YbiS/YcfS/YnhG family)
MADPDHFIAKSLLRLAGLAAAIGRSSAVTLPLALSALAPVTTSAMGQTCLAPLQDARRLLLVTAPTMNTLRATMQLFERDAEAAPWHAVHAAEPAVLGRSGMAWGPAFRDLTRDGEPVKTEGDMRTPAGFYRIGRTFGFGASLREGYLQLKSGETVCVDDPTSPAYNTITSRAMIEPKVHAEDMGVVVLYRRGLVVEYPTDAAGKAGSCIFIHVWRAADRGTAGCIALPEPRVSALQDFAEHGAVVAILPQGALDRLTACLPKTAPKGKSETSSKHAK